MLDDPALYFQISRPSCSKLEWGWHVKHANSSSEAKEAVCQYLIMSSKAQMEQYIKAQVAVAECRHTGGVGVACGIWFVASSG
jgi:hypothetical protein